MVASNLSLIVGLGNPGPKYEQTRHNAGALFVEGLAHAYGEPLRPQSRFHGSLGRIQVQGTDLHLLVPGTYMNRSGQAVRAVADFYRFSPGQILVAHDDLDLPPGTAKLKQGGGHGGHNGLRDIIAHLGSPDFRRLRLGIGHPGDSRAVVNYVLSRLGKDENAALAAVIGETIDVLPLILADDWSGAMNRLHAFRAESP